MEARGRMRASHADREQVIGTLKAAFVQGRLTKDDFDLRVSQTYAARTYAELAAVTADLPAGLTADQPPTRRAPGNPSPTLRPGPVLTVATTLYAGAWAYELFLSTNGGDNPTTPPVIFGGGLVYLIVLLLCLGHMLALRREKRTGGQLPRRPAPGAGGRASARPRLGGPRRQLPPVDPGHPPAAEAARSRPLRRPSPGFRSVRRCYGAH